MSDDRHSVPVSLPAGLVEELDALVPDGQFGSLPGVELQFATVRA